MKQTDEEASCQRAVDWLNDAAESLAKWYGSVRAEPGQFRWARETTRPPNVAATKYVLDGMVIWGLDKRLITDEDRRLGAAWIEPMRRPGGQFDDPAITGRRPDNWPPDKPYPDPPLQTVINQYARGSLGYYLGRFLPPPPPPPGIPQVHEAHKALEYVKTRSWRESAWSAGSHSMRMGIWLLQWYKEGKIDAKPLVDVINWLFSQQDPATGLWGPPTQATNHRINGVFKLMMLLCHALRLPLPYADKIIDQVLAEMARPDYDETAGGCDEFDNLFVLATAADYTDHRAEEIRQTMLQRLGRIRLWQQQDGGLSYSRTYCAPAWCDVDMAPAIAQGDCMAPPMFGMAVNICVDRLGIADAVPNTGKWRNPAEPESEEIRQKIRGLVNL